MTLSARVPGPVRIPSPGPVRIPGPVQLKAPALVSKAVFDGLRLGLSLANSSGLNEGLKAAGATWLAACRMWLMNEAQPEKVVATLSRCCQFPFDQEAVELLVRRALLQAEPNFFAPALDVQVFPLSGGDLAVASAMDPHIVQCMRRIGGHFHRAAKAWQVPVKTAVVLDSLWKYAGIQPEYVYVHETVMHLDEFSKGSSGKSPITVPALAPERPESSTNKSGRDQFLSAITGSITRLQVSEAQLRDEAAACGLRSHQVSGVRFVVSSTSCLLGDDMGLGKTRQAIVASKLLANGGKVLIACPASLRTNWEREIHAVYSTASVGLVGEDRVQTLYRCDWIIANYERLGCLVREKELGFAVFVVDEAHYLKEHQTGRTRNAFVLAARIPRRILVTGTPLLNREIELHTLLRLSGHPLGALELASFRKQFSGSAERRADLAKALSGWMIRRRKDVLTDLGKKHRQVMYVSPVEGLGPYLQVFNDMTMMQMPKIVALRQTLERLKTDFLINTIEGLSEDDKIIVFCEYMVTVGHLIESLRDTGIAAVSLIGSDSAAKRQKAIDAFQGDANVKVFVASTAAAGVGITLTAANFVVFASLPWNPAIMRQAEDRAYRLGQQRDVRVLVPLIPNTIDEQVWQLLQSKTALESDVVEAVACTVS